MPNNNPQTPQQQISRAAESATKAVDRASETAERAASVAIEKVRHVREDALSGLEQQREHTADRIRRVASALRMSGQSLSVDDAVSQQLFDAAGERVERVAEYISNVTPSTLAQDVTTLAKRSPGLFFGGSFLIGLALGRFAKSTGSSLASSSYALEGEEDEFEETTPQVAPRTPSRSRASNTPARRTASATSGAKSESTAAGTRSEATGSHSTATVAGGTIPSYGGTPLSGTPLVGSPQPAQPSTVSATPRETDRGEGNKS